MDNIEKKPRPIRPVKCHFCNQPMFYMGDPKHEQEVSVSAVATGGKDFPDKRENFYAHVRCWNGRMNDTSRLDWLEGHLPKEHAFGKAPSGTWQIFGEAGLMEPATTTLRQAIDSVIKSYGN